MKVIGTNKNTGTEKNDVWAEGDCSKKLKDCLIKIQDMCLDEKVIFDRDAMT